MFSRVPLEFKEIRKEYRQRKKAAEEAAKASGKSMSNPASQTALPGVGTLSNMGVPGAFVAHPMATAMLPPPVIPGSYTTSIGGPGPIPPGVQRPLVPHSFPDPNQYASRRHSTATPVLPPFGGEGVKEEREAEESFGDSWSSGVKQQAPIYGNGMHDLMGRSKENGAVGVGGGTSWQY
jgi:hypothetical protein